MTKIAPYGSWKSPITTDQIIAGTISLDQVQLDGENIYWLEGRPKEKGRYVIVRRNEQGSTTDVLPAPFNARTLVHEYGGGAYAVQKGVIYFSNFDDQRLYRLAPDESPQALTPESDLKLRYADFSLSDSGACYCVREDHRGDGEAVNTIVRVDPDAENEGTVLTSGADFYSDPRLSPDGKQLVWMEWDHPNMPWDGCRLMLAQITESGKLANVTLIAGSEDESIFQPEWSPEGVLYFVSDRSGWWNLYRYRKAEVECII